MITPFRYQLEDARALHRLGGRALLASSMGLGKSITSLLYADMNKQLRPIIILCGASHKYQWERECARFRWRAEVLSGARPEPLYLVRRPKVVICNYDILERHSKKGKEGWLGWLLDLHAKLVILDECGAYLANPGTQRTKAVKALCNEVPKVLALSGTPLVNRPAELWPVLNILRPREYPSFWPFGMEFCSPRRIPFGTGWDFRGASHLPKLHAQLKTLMVRRRTEEVVSELPPLQRRVVPLDIEKRKEYEQAEKNFLMWLSRYDPTRLPKALKAERLVQLTTLKRLVGKLKLPFVVAWLESFLKEADEKIIVGTAHKEVLKHLQAKYKKISVVIDGSVTGKNRQLAVDQFQSNPSIRFLFGQLRAAGTGLNLTAAQHSAFSEYGWSPGEHLQFERRCYARIGGLHGATSWWLVAHGTLEEKLAQILQEKQKVLSAVLDGGQGEDLNVFEQLTLAMLREKR